MAAFHVLLGVGSLVSWIAIALGCYAAGLTLYRLFLSPLAGIPGPKFAALTYWYECYYDVVQPGQYVFKIKELHNKYGPIVRITPDEVSICDPDFVDTIYAPGPGHKRDKDIQKVKALGINSSIGGSISHELHRKRREALNPFFSQQRIGRLDPELADQITQIEAVFSRASASGEVLNLSDIYYAFCNDIVHQYCFGNNANLLHDLSLAGTQRQNVASVLRRTKFNLQFSWVRDMMQKLPPAVGISITPPGIRDIIAFRRSIRAQVASILAGKPSSTETPSIFTHLRDSPDLPISEKSPQRLEDEATLLIMAGTFSPMLSLIVAHYHLISRPDIMAKLRAELSAHPSAVTATQLEQLPYLGAVIQEAHRLTFGLTGRNPRVCPDEPLLYYNTQDAARATARASPPPPPPPPRTYTIPAGTSVSASTLLLHTNESLFPQPWAFDPERWLLPEDPALLGRRRRAMMSFMRGTRGCIGKHLANAEIAVAIAAMARWDMRLYETTADDVSFYHDYHVMCPKLDSKGVRVKVSGRAGEE